MAESTTPETAVTASGGSILGTVAKLAATGAVMALGDIGVRAVIKVFKKEEKADPEKLELSKSQKEALVLGEAEQIRLRAGKK